MSLIALTPAHIDKALPKVALGLRKYEWLQRELFRRNVARDPEYQTRFATYYRVRRGSGWRQAFFDLLEHGKTIPPSLSDALLAVYEATGRVEASFASKLVATIDPSKPVIDSVVLRNLGLRLPNCMEVALRIEGVAELYQRMAYLFAEFLKTGTGRYLVTQFNASYPGTSLTEVKMLDLVLWQTR